MPMQGPRAPWWVYAVAACVLGFLALNLSAELYGPGAIGANLRYRDGRTVVVSVMPGYPAEHAGLGPGDVIVTADGRSVRTLFHWRAVLENAEVTRPLPLDIERGGQRASLSLELHPNWYGWTAGNWVTFGIRLAAQIVTFSLGMFVGMAGLTPVSMGGFFNLPAWVGDALKSPPALAGASLMFLVLPASFAYATLRHQIFDIKLILRQGLQYALARRLVVSLVPACAVVLAIDLLVHGSQPLAGIVLSRGWIYAAVAGLAWAAHHQRRRWIEALDRRFFRERYDAQRLMLTVVEDIRRAAGLQSVAPQVVAQIASALHPEYVALLVREAGDPLYRTLASAPAGGIPLSLPGESKVAALVRLLGKPLDVGPGQSGWLRQQLPPEEADLVRSARAALLVPVAATPAGPEVLLALGEKRSEDPYSREDQEFLAAAAWARCTRRSTRHSTGAWRSSLSARSCSEARRPPTGSASRRARPRASRIPTS